MLCIPFTAKAYSDYIIASGENIGINIKTEGVLIVGSYKIGDYIINADNTIKIGDTIKKVENQEIKTVEELTNKVNNSDCTKLEIELVRNLKPLKTTLNLKQDNGICKTGLYVKDSITGIGTLTYIDPNTKLFGALGHEIIDSQSGDIIKTNDGTIFNSEVVGIERSEPGTPGEKNSRYDSSNIFGHIFENTNKGIFGNYEININNNNLLKVAKPSEVKTGEAEILTVLNLNEVLKYKINITKINISDKTKNIMFEVIDPSLLNKTGGIVQGMSGSPIIQDNKIIGAITHVVINDPKKGYGILITNMLEEAEN
ncbi:MAG: SpoIVB peptidase [Bacilli bacterium]